MKLTNILARRFSLTRKPSTTKVNRYINQYQQKFLKLKSLDDNYKTNYQSKYDYYFSNLSILSDRLNWIFSDILTALLIISYILELLIFSKIFNRDYQIFIPSDIFFNISFIFSAGALLLFIIPLMTVLYFKVKTKYFLRAILSILLICIIFFSIFIFDFDFEYANNNIFSIMMGLLSIFLSFFIMYILFIFLAWYRDILIKSKYPEAYIIIKLINVIIELEAAPMNWTDLEKRQINLTRLEEIANCIEFYLTRQLRSGDIITDTWTKETLKRIAIAIRDKKRWIITPKKDTYYYLLLNLTSTMKYIADGNWDALEKIEPTKINQPLLWYHQILTVLKTLLIASIPALSLWGFELTPLALTGAVREYVTIGVFSWAIIAILAAVDPAFERNLSALKDITSLLPQWGKDNKP